MVGDADVTYTGSQMIIYNSLKTAEHTRMGSEMLLVLHIIFSILTSEFKVTPLTEKNIQEPFNFIYTI